MSHHLVIVESPTKAKTIGKFLGRGYTVLSSFGHVRDLPKSALGVDVEHEFQPKYIVPREKLKQVKTLKEAAKKADKILFATDEDREGEAISWHLAEILQVPPEKLERITFHEITKRAIEHALENPRPLDQHLVDAQQARRVLDRLVGYELSPFLWRKIQKGLSAGRVQSVAVRLVVEREREREVFKPQEYWTIEALLSKNEKNFPAKLHTKNGTRLEKLAIESKENADQILQSLNGATYRISNISQKTVRRSPPPPFSTSTLQQDANTKLGLTAKDTMRLAQKLYEGVEIPGEGSVALITYMRTDSVNLSDLFLQETTTFIRENFKDIFTLPEPRRYKTKSKGAQEAHEAIRPTDVRRHPDQLQNVLDRRLWRLYDLVWRRAVATQLPEAIFESTTVDIATNTPYAFRTAGSMIRFEGYLKVYAEKQKETLLPDLIVEDILTLVQLDSKEHVTEPPPRYSDATLVKTLEEYGIGRPSTYAPTIATIIDRGYVERDEQKKLFPGGIAKTVNDLLVEHFPNIVDYAFTANMEQKLDAVADGETPWVPVIRAFYEPFHQTLEEKEKTVARSRPDDVKTDISCDKCNSPMVIKHGRFGKFLACSNYPTCKNTKPLKDQGEGAPPEVETTNEICPTCQAPMVIKHGRFGPFLSCSRYPECKTIKNIESKIGITCPVCKKGELVEKRTRQKRTFYGCNQYPACSFALWQKPTGETCPKCNSLIVFAAKGSVRCSSKECDFEKTTNEE
ncbi:MAG: topoisomerase I protein [Candidatus Uhrbacteria bacterium GW2011_GWF2_41_16]|uniref:DNA topoisomerase 1 n=2 Tax=Candidatus Uhriibacteriota TaxID=1752732 RepID=A0A0G0YEK1_9BACT|nr:MAG: topoisomerase I protein [Candidatus Uhrbacteria bacterium GW2011_GWA2_41_10]KKR87813.1 MAG: topoisomerase I protein [Candidatus Uhrbacteria bacterium GW2011_GWC2_41_11]KKR98752.1 MAG: topoisomerase I protein [Candidatus Uhrbacteria bacterium GW2011_GWF2_41_16]HBP00130.1 type I DNA topoisomerase [Candidatus Uhrbacteria bacterium]